MFGLDVGLVLALGGTAISLLSWYKNQTRSQYAHEREFAHIMRNLEQHSKAVADIADQVDEVSDRQSRLETLILARFDSAQRTKGGING